MAVLLAMTPSAQAQVLHEDPDSAGENPSLSAIFRYYSEMLDFVLRRDFTKAEQMLEKGQFMNLPESLKGSKGKPGIADAGIFSIMKDSLSVLRDTSQDMTRLGKLIGQSNLADAIKVEEGIFSSLASVYQNKEKIKLALGAVDKEYKISSAPESSELRIAYYSVIGRLEAIETSFRDSYMSLKNELEELKRKALLPTDLKLNVRVGTAFIEPPTTDLELNKRASEAFTQPLPTDLELDKRASAAFTQPLTTDLELKIAPSEAFVGDEIGFDGYLTSEGKPLSGREVGITVNGSIQTVVSSADNGSYRGSLRVPYLYTDEMYIQALYSPEGKDKELYASSLSQAVKLKTLFYRSRLEVDVKGEAYPGLEKEISGRFDYGQSPASGPRKVQFYLDGTFLGEEIAGQNFSRKIRIGPVISEGYHSISVLAEPSGRYSSAAFYDILDITRMTPYIDYKVSGLALVPGKFTILGKVSSKKGPLRNAKIKISTGKYYSEILSKEDGGFSGKVKINDGFIQTGRQDLIIQVVPAEPWHAPVTARGSIFVINVINIGIIVFVIILLPFIYRLRGVEIKLLWNRWREKRAREAPVLAKATGISDSGTMAVSVEAEREPEDSPRSRILYWYRLTARFLMRGAGTALTAHQTLREFAQAAGRALGPLAGYFLELTRMVERLLYSRYKPTEEDAVDSRRMSEEVRRIK